MPNEQFEIIVGADAADPRVVKQAFVELGTYLNHLPEHHIAYFGTTGADIANVLAEAAPPAASGILLARSDDATIGGLALDFSTQIGRTWLLGPFVDDERWAEIATALYDAAQHVIPVQAAQHEVFCDVRHVRCCAWAEQLGFALDGETGIDTFARASMATLPPPDATVTRLDQPHGAAFDALHDQLFPRTYANGPQLRARDGEHSAIFIHAEGGDLLGYVAGKVMLDTHEGYIDYVGTAARARRQGVARRLVIAALHWMFAFPEVQCVNLTVNAGNAAADALYRSLGFERERVTRVYRRQVAPPAQ